jgi:hypothetical protein
MGLDTNKRQEVVYFTGTEVEHTAMYGERTLFVVGVQPCNEIQKRADAHGIKHLYFGTSQSFAPESDADWAAWENMIKALLSAGYWCTLDYDVFYVKEVLELGFDEHNNFINMISVKLPYIKQFNYNATLKLDDNTWGDTNSGVWCHSIHSLMDRRVYTDWRDYVGDEVID